MDAPGTLAFIAVGALVGAVGQGLRAIVGIRKRIEEAKRASPQRTVADWFDGRRLGLSFVLGGLAGVLAALVQYAPEAAISREMLMGFHAAGYGGADFIEGFMEKWLPGRPGGAPTGP